jgi:NAD(P)-dependent dehydrogenase (short-subunit alcohol dehydrogenase family)
MSSATISKRVFDLTGKRAILTGAAGHLGQAITQGLADAGADLLLLGRNAAKLEKLVETLRAQGRSASYQAIDLSLPEEIGAFAEQLVSEGKPVDILVNNAYSGVTNSLENSTADQYASSYQIGMIAAAELVRTLLPAMRAAVAERGDASVVNVASMYGHVSPDARIYGDSGQNNPPFYGAVKGALIQYTRYAACHLAKDGIRVNAVSPGPFPPITFRETKPDFYKELINKVPMGRIGLPEDLAGPVVFLSSSASAYVTGVNLPVDGGWTAW